MCLWPMYFMYVCMYDLQIFYAKNNDMGGSKRKLFYFNLILFCSQFVLLLVNYIFILGPVVY